MSTRIIVPLLLLLAGGAFAQLDFNFEKELLYEKRLEERVNKALATFLAPTDFILIADVKLTESETDQRPGSLKLRESTSELRSLDLKLPGVLDLPLPGFEQQREEDGRANVKGAGGEPQALERIILTLFLDKDVPDTKTEVIQAIAIKTAQLDLNRGDELNMRIIDFGGGEVEASSVAQQTPTPVTEKTQGRSAALDEMLAGDRTLLYLLGGLVLLVLVLFVLLLLKGRKTEYSYMPHYPQPTPMLQAYPQPMYQEPRPAPINQNKQSSESSETAGKPSTAQTSDKQVPRYDFDFERRKQDVINMMFSRPEAVCAVAEDVLREDGGLRSLAALIRVFGVDTAKSLFQALDAAVVNRIFSYYVTVEGWNDDEPAVALARFSDLLRNHRLQNVLDEAAVGPFGFVRKMSDEQISYLVKGEGVPVLALFLAHLSPQRSAKVLAQMDERMASAVVAEIGNLKYVDVDVINAVGRRLAEKSMTMPRFDFYPGAGIDTLVQILDNLEPSYERSLLASLSEQDSRVALDLKKAYFTFEDLTLVSKEPLKEVIKQIPRSVLATSLVGVKEELLRKILGVLPERRAEMLKFEIDKLSTTAAKDVVKAQKMIVAKIRDMIKNGEFDLSKAMRGEEKPEGAETSSGDSGEASSGS
ncbi:MAG: hypothetical protein A2284_08150 [Deltaproteobacteria bacterium RIFOXYA12_FULL_61_11]|nr:MAG: hypothetical protein A2284_08150 [Deltaproteobacteria bacterium RIFOXYA12_FULL_61_11]